MQTNAFSVWVLWNITMVVVFLAYKFGHPELAASWVIAGTGMLLACSTLPLTIYAGAGVFFRSFRITIPSDKRDTEITSTFFDLDQPVDPWDLQAKLMSMSGDPIPQVPKITHAVLATFAALLEEVAETGTLIAQVIAREGGKPDAWTGKPCGVGLFMLAQDMAPTLRAMDDASRHIRAVLACADFQEWEGMRLTLAEAHDLFHEVTYIQIVNTGLALAMGLPGAEGYQRVHNSNVSKANPLTGRIDKDPSGKWIRGANYRRPELDQLLIDHSPELYAELLRQPVQ